MTESDGMDASLGFAQESFDGGATPPISSFSEGIFSGSGAPNDHAARTFRRNGIGESALLVDAPATMESDIHPPRSMSPSNNPNAEPLPQKIKVIWGTNIVVRDAVIAFREFLASFTLGHAKIAQGISLSESLQDTVPIYPAIFTQIRETEGSVFNLDMANLKAFQPTKNLFYQLIKFPQEIIPLMDVVVNEVYMETFPGIPPPEPALQVRPFNCERRVNMRELNPDDIDQLVSVKGLVIRASNIIPDMRTAFFKCSMCDFSVSVESVKGKISPPSHCPREDCKANQSMEIVYNRSIYNSKQILRIQETPDMIPEGQTPHTVSMCLYDSLIDKARPGDKIEVTGIFRASPIRLNPRMRKMKTQFRTFVDVVHILRSSSNRLAAQTDSEIGNADEQNSSTGIIGSLNSSEETDALRQQNETKIAQLVEHISHEPNLYTKLARSIAPSIYGLENVKKSLLLQMLGGVSKSIRKGNGGIYSLRGDINVLLAGDPGVSKSQLLQYVHKLNPRSVYTSGKGSSAVGLTAYVTRDPESKQLVLESGALVLSDGGICCIDEFDKMSDATRAVLHEVMEQQTISVAKAGIITTLNARTSILASANPVDSKYNNKKTIVDNLNLPPSLLSRFDIICLLLDNGNDQVEDKRIASHIISLYEPQDEASSEDAQSKNEFFDVKTLTAYISYCKKLEPVLSEEAVKLLATNYLQMRKINGMGAGKAVSATTRQLESLIRLSEAHAKMRTSLRVEAEDVEEATRLVREALLSYAIDPLTGKIDIDLINTGRSSALREQSAALKRQLKSLLGSVNSSVDFTWLMREVASNSSVAVPEKMLRDVLEELVDEEFIVVVGSGASAAANAVKHGNPQIRRVI
jgi:DNA replication licensing factor MCM4